MQGKALESGDVTRIYLSLGSNLGDREASLREAIEALGSQVAIDKVSSIYETSPVGVTDQPEFLNAAVSAETSLGPENLLSEINQVEADLGRVRGYRWGPRVIDIDILLYGDLRLKTRTLAIPHPEMQNRAFVLVPLAEIAPRAVHPTTGLTIAQLVELVPGKESVRFYQPTTAA